MEKKYFVRKATGLVREIGLTTGIVMIMAHVVGLGWQKRVFQCIGWMPIREDLFIGGFPPLSMSFLLIGIVCLFNIYCFSVMGAAMPRAGGGYVFISRILSPLLGFVATWGHFFMICMVWGVIAAAGMEALWLFGILIGWEIPLHSSLVFWTGIVTTIIFAILGILGTRPTVIVMHIIFWIPVIALIVLYAVFLVITPAAMEAGILALTGHRAIEYTEAALAQGMAEVGAGYGFWDAAGVGMIGAYWAYIGYAATSFVAGEVKEASKSLPKILFAANIFIILIYLSISYLMARAGMMAGAADGYSFLTSLGFLSYGGGSFAEAGLPGIRAWMPIVGALGAEGLGWGWVKYLLVLFGVLWPINDIPPFIFVSSRIIFAMSFDRTLPEWLAKVHERFRSPMNAMIAAAIIAVVGVFAESEFFSPPPYGTLHVPWLHLFINSGSGVVATDLWDLFFMFCASIAAIAFAYRRRDIYDKSPFKGEIAGVPLVAVCGVIALIGNLAAMWVVVTSPYSPLNPATEAGRVSLAVTAVVLIIGALIYIYYKARARITGVDYTTIYAEIPPE